MKTSDAKPPTVFVSYTWDSQEHQAKCLQLVDSLRLNGVDADIDVGHSQFPDGLTRWMTQKIVDSDFVICVCTEKYGARLLGHPEPRGVGEGGRWEGGLILSYLKTDGGGRFLPIVFDKADIPHIPAGLNDLYRYQVPEEMLGLLRRIFGKPAVTLNALGTAPEFPVLERLPFYDAIPAQSEPGLPTLNSEASSVQSIRTQKPLPIEERFLAEICRIALERDTWHLNLADVQSWLDAEGLDKRSAQDAFDDLDDSVYIRTAKVINGGALTPYFELLYHGYLKWADTSDQDERVNKLTFRIAQSLVQASKDQQLAFGQVTSKTLADEFSVSNVEARFILERFKSHGWIRTFEGNSGGVINGIRVESGLRKFVRDHADRLTS